MSDEAKCSAFFAGLFEADRSALLLAGDKRPIATRDVLFGEGSAPQEIMVVLSGTVMLTRCTGPDDYVVVELRRAGDILGEFSVFDDSSRSAGAVAVTDCTVLAIDTPTFLQLADTHPGICLAVKRAMVAKARQSTDRQIEHSTMDSLGRVCARLVELCTHSGTRTDQGWEVPSLLSQAELAAWVGVSRDAVVGALRQGRRLGWLETGRLRFVITDLSAIENRAIPA